MFLYPRATHVPIIVIMPRNRWPNPVIGCPNDIISGTIFKRTTKVIMATLDHFVRKRTDQAEEHPAGEVRICPHLRDFLFKADGPDNSPLTYKWKTQSAQEACSCCRQAIQNQIGPLKVDKRLPLHRCNLVLPASKKILPPPVLCFLRIKLQLRAYILASDVLTGGSFQ